MNLKDNEKLIFSFESLIRIIFGFLAGYGGKNCQVKDPCANSPCQNGGYCNPTSKSDSSAYFCICPLEYSGENCEIGKLNNLKKYFFFK